MDKNKPTKKKINSGIDPNKLVPLADMMASVTINRYTEIALGSNEEQSHKWWQFYLQENPGALDDIPDDDSPGLSFSAISVDGLKDKVTIPEHGFSLSYEHEEDIIGFGGLDKQERMSWISNLLDLGIMLKRFAKTKNQDLALKIIRRFPETLFDDASMMLALFFVSLSQKDNGFKLKLDISRKTRGHFVHPYLKGSFYTQFSNPIKRQVAWWYYLGRYGNRKEQTSACNYLMKAGLRCLVPQDAKSPGRKKVSLELNGIGNKPFGNPYWVMADRRLQAKETIKTTYEDILKDIRDICKSKPRTPKLIQYLEERELITPIAKYYSITADNYKNTKLIVATEIFKERSPSEMAWVITGARLGASPKTLRKLSKIS